MLPPPKLIEARTMAAKSTPKRDDVFFPDPPIWQERCVTFTLQEESCGHLFLLIHSKEPEDRPEERPEDGRDMRKSDSRALGNNLSMRSELHQESVSCPETFQG